MKSLKLVTYVTIGLIAVFAASGCKKKPQNTMPMPTSAMDAPKDGEGSNKNPLNDNVKPIAITPEGNPKGSTVNPADLIKDSGTPVSNRSIDGRPQDREKFKAFTVYFDFDSSVVKSSETSKADSVASQFKTLDPESDLLIEGHCDERGTPEYNRALGERRAQAIREYLTRAGVDPNRIHTISFGKDKPAELGHNQAAWDKNRRGEFIYVLPKK